MGGAERLISKHHKFKFKCNTAKKHVEAVVSFPMCGATLWSLQDCVACSDEDLVHLLPQ